MVRKLFSCRVIEHPGLGVGVDFIISKEKIVANNMGRVILSL